MDKEVWQYKMLHKPMAKATGDEMAYNEIIIIIIIILALPVSSCGLRLADEAVRVAVALRLGCSVCILPTLVL